jgi:hypothetical protein
MEPKAATGDQAMFGVGPLDSMSKRETVIKHHPAPMRVLSEAVAIHPTTYERLHGLRREVYFGYDYHEGIQAFLEKRPAMFEIESRKEEKGLRS